MAIAGISGAAYAVSDSYCDGGNRFIENLNLDETRAQEVEQILSSYKRVGTLAMSGQHEKIPEFLTEKEALLAEVLTEQGMQQLKENIGEWVESRDFYKFGKMSVMTFGQHN